MREFCDILGGKEIKSLILGGKERKVVINIVSNNHGDIEHP